MTPLNGMRLQLMVTMTINTTCNKMRNNMKGIRSINRSISRSISWIMVSIMIVMNDMPKNIEIIWICHYGQFGFFIRIYLLVSSYWISCWSPTPLLSPSPVRIAQAQITHTINYLLQAAPRSLPGWEDRRLCWEVMPKGRCWDRGSRAGC